MTYPENPAFPLQSNPGLAKREWFAGMALQGWLACPDAITRPVEELAVETADDLIKELNKVNSTNPTQPA